jgi:L-rhamnose-H+ transport protein
MTGANPFLGVTFHAIGGLAAASFYLPYKRVRQWPWETFWLVGGVFSWLIAPLVGAALLSPHLLEALRDTPAKSILYTYGFGVLWGVGGLTFGLSMRYLGIALGYAIALGMCALFGTIVPPIFDGSIVGLIHDRGGQIVLGGLGICLLGICVSGLAGAAKQRELSEEQKRSTVAEFDLTRGLLVALFCGVMSACMSFAFAAGKPIARSALDQGSLPLWQNLPVLVVALLGGLTTNLVWCLALNLKNRTIRTYVASQSVEGRVPLGWNYLLCAAGGIIWYLQFFFYGMGTTQMGRYDFSSWSLHMASIIIFSTLWGLTLKEWKGTSVRTHVLVGIGLAVLIGSMLVIGWGNSLAAGSAR